MTGKFRETILTGFEFKRYFSNKQEIIFTLKTKVLAQNGSDVTQRCG